MIRFYLSKIIANFLNKHVFLKIPHTYKKLDEN